MHKEVLTKKEAKLLSLVNKFSKNFALAGGTAIALHIGHRQSIDFDLFSLKDFDNSRIREKIIKTNKIERVFIDRPGEFTCIVNGVKLTFLKYPFKVKFDKNFKNIIKLPDLLTLSAMKAYTLGRRAKWKDYVDLYFIMKDYYTIDKIIKKTKQIFGDEFNAKMFRAQLAYFKDIDYSEKVIFIKEFELSDTKIKKELMQFSIL